MTSATAADPTPGVLPDGTPMPTEAVEDPANISPSGQIAPGVPEGTAEEVLASVSIEGIPSAALSAYQRAAQVIDTADPSCNIEWPLIGAIGRVESDHGRYGGNTLTAEGVTTPGIYGIPLDGSNGTARITDTDAGRYDKDTSFDRAVGPMQFIPSTWSVVGVDGDGDGERNPQDLDDAALATAVYLCSGDEDLSMRPGQEAAVYRYNHSQEYVELVLSIMEAYAAGDYSAVPNSSSGSTTFIPSFGDPVVGSGGGHFARGGGGKHARGGKGGSGSGRGFRGGYGGKFGGGSTGPTGSSSGGQDAPTGGSTGGGGGGLLGGGGGGGGGGLLGGGGSGGSGGSTGGGGLLGGGDGGGLLGGGGSTDGSGGSTGGGGGLLGGGGGLLGGGGGGGGSTGGDGGGLLGGGGSGGGLLGGGGSGGGGLLGGGGGGDSDGGGLLGGGGGLLSGGGGTSGGGGDSDGGGLLGGTGGLLDGGKRLVEDTTTRLLSTDGSSQDGDSGTVVEETPRVVEKTTQVVQETTLAVEDTTTRVAEDTTKVTKVVEDTAKVVEDTTARLLIEDDSRTQDTGDTNKQDAGGSTGGQPTDEGTKQTEVELVVEEVLAEVETVATKTEARSYCLEEGLSLFQVPTCVTGLLD